MFQSEILLLRKFPENLCVVVQCKHGKAPLFNMLFQPTHNDLDEQSVESIQYSTMHGVIKSGSSSVLIVRDTVSRC